MSPNERMMRGSKPFGGARQPSPEIPIGNLAHELALLLAGFIARSVGTLQRDAQPTNSNPASSIVAANLAAGQRRLPPTFEDAPTARTPAPRAPACEDHDLVIDESMLIAPTWRVPESHEKGWYSQPLRAALFGIAISLIIGLAGLLWLTGFF